MWETIKVVLSGFVALALVEVVGALIVWGIKKFKTKFSDELVLHGVRNFLVGIIPYGGIIFVLILLGVIKL
jgi:uncharacterized Tic20 family protein